MNPNEGKRDAIAHVWATARHARWGAEQRARVRSAGGGWGGGRARAAHGRARGVPWARQGRRRAVLTRERRADGGACARTGARPRAQR